MRKKSNHPPYLGTLLEARRGTLLRAAGRGAHPHPGSPTETSKQASVHLSVLPEDPGHPISFSPLTLTVTPKRSPAVSILQMLQLRPCMFRGLLAASQARGINSALGTNGRPWVSMCRHPQSQELMPLWWGSLCRGSEAFICPSHKPGDSNKLAHPCSQQPARPAWVLEGWSCAWGPAGTPPCRQD